VIERRFAELRAITFLMKPTWFDVNLAMAALDALAFKR